MADATLETMAQAITTMAETVTKVLAVQEDEDPTLKVIQTVDPAQISCANARAYYEEWRVLGEQRYASNLSTSVRRYKYLSRQCVGKAKTAFGNYTRGVFGQAAGVLDAVPADSELWDERYEAVHAILMKTADCTEDMMKSYYPEDYNKQSLA